MAKTIRNAAGQVQRVNDDHPVLNDPDVTVIPDEGEDEGTGVNYEEWTAEELLAHAEEHGIDVGQATSPATLASRIRAAEEG